MTHSAPTGKICIAANELTHLFRNGGIGTHNWLLADVLNAAGWKVHILYCSEVESAAQLVRCRRMLEAKGIALWHIDDFEGPAADLVGCGIAGPWDSHSMRVFRAIEALDEAQHFDLIEFGEWGGHGFRTIQARRMGLALRNARIIVKLHASNQWCREANRGWLGDADELLRDYYERYCFENADVQLSPSRYMLSYAQGIGWQARPDSRVLPYCFPRTTAGVAPRDAPPRELVYFGRLEHRKGLKLFLEVAKSLPPEVSFAFLGREVPIDGVMPAKLIKQALVGRQYAIHVNFDRDEALEYLRAAGRVAIVPSLNENFPFTVLECATNGIPFLASNVGGIPEIVSDAELRECVLFEPNPGAMAQRIENYLKSDGASRRQYVERMLERCESTRNHAAVCQAYAEMLPKAKTELTDGTVGQMTGVDDLWERGDSHLAKRSAQHERVSDNSGLPMVSVVVPYYNLGDYLPEALASLAAQEYPRTEVIVVDDGSTDEASQAVLQQMKREYAHFRFLGQDNAGLGGARNAGLAVARGEFFLPFDADNIARPFMVSRFVRALQRNPNVAAVTCYHLAFTKTADITARRFCYAYRPCGGPFVAAALRNVYGDANGMFRTAALRAIGGYETDRDTGYEDWELYVKLARTGHQIDVIPEYLFYYRHRATSMLRTTDSVLNRRRVLRQFFSADGLPRAEQIQLWSALAGFDEMRRCQSIGQSVVVKQRHSTAYRIAREVKRVIRQAPYYDTISGRIKRIKQRAA